MVRGRHRGVMVVGGTLALVSCTAPAGPSAAPTSATVAAPVGSVPTTSIAPSSPDDVLTTGAEVAERLEAVTIANVLEPPLDDRRVRRALVLALDPEAIVESSGLDPATTRFGFPVAGPAAGPLLDQARALLDEYRHDPSRSDGERPGEPVRLGYRCPHDPSVLPRILALVDQWGTIGAEVTPEVPEQLITEVMGHEQPDDADPFVSRGSWRGRYQLACWAFPADEPSLDRLLEFVGEQATSPMNLTNVSDPRLADAREALRSDPTEPARRRHVATIVEVLDHDGVVMWHGTITRGGPARPSDP